PEGALCGQPVSRNGPLGSPQPDLPIAHRIVQRVLYLVFGVWQAAYFWPQVGFIIGAAKLQGHEMVKLAGSARGYTVRGVCLRELERLSLRFRWPNAGRVARDTDGRVDVGLRHPRVGAAWSAAPVGQFPVVSCVTWPGESSSDDARVVRPDQRSITMMMG